MVLFEKADGTQRGYKLWEAWENFNTKVGQFKIKDKTTYLHPDILISLRLAYNYVFSRQYPVTFITNLFSYLLENIS